MAERERRRRTPGIKRMADAPAYAQKRWALHADGGRGCMNKAKKLKGRIVWDSCRNAIGVYRNAEKIDLLLSRAWGHLVESFTVEEGSENKSKVGISAKLAGLASLLGFDVETGIEAERSKSLVNSRLGSLTYDNKLNILLDYAKTHQGVRYVDLLSGMEYFPFETESNDPHDWRRLPFSAEDTEFIGYVSGHMRAKRIEPPPKPGETLLSDIIAKRAGLWLFETGKKENKLKGHVPCLVEKFYYSSQTSILALHHSSESGVNMQALGLVLIKNSQLSVDPLWFAVLH